MKMRQIFLYPFFVLLMVVFQVSAQVDSGIKLISPTDVKNYANDMSGDGRFVVIESDGNIATYNPRNADRNTEIFLLDYAQRHIFQLTNTKSALRNPSGSTTEQANILVVVNSRRPKISNDGRWIIFSSNATTSISTSSPNNTNPGNFDGNVQGTPQILQQDGNTELWLYQLPIYQSVDISSGVVPPFVDLITGVFIQVTNSPASRLPFSGTSTNSPVIGDDNRDASINDDGSTVAFTSNRDLVSGGNTSPNANDEIFVYKRNGQSGVISQTTMTLRGSVVFPISQGDASISGDGRRVVFRSNATNPVPGMNGGCNPDFDWEVNFTDLNEQGTPDGIMRQVTFTTSVDYNGTTYLNPTTRSISRNGRYILINSRARLTTPNDEGIEPEFAYFIYDSQAPAPTTACKKNAEQFRQINPRANADVAVPSNYEFFRYPEFTDYDPVTLTPSTIIFSSRMNLRPNGTVAPTNSGEGLNQSSSRPIQVYSYSFSNSTPLYTRLTNSPSIDFGRTIKATVSNKRERITTTITDDVGTVAIFYLLTPNAVQEDNDAQLNFFTGASAIPINSSPPQAQGLMPDMLGSVIYLSQLTTYAGGFATQVSKSRSFTAPLQLKGITLTIDGIAANLTRAYNGQINFIVPPNVTAGIKPVVINDNGIILRGNIQIIQSPRPDVVTDNTETTPSGGGRARVLNVTDPNNPRSEPFTVTTQTSNGPVPTRLRIFLTGVKGVAASSISIKVGNVIIPSSLVLTSAVESDYPGMFTFDFTLPQTLNGAGDVPVVVTVDNIESRSTSTAPHILITANQIMSSELAVWRPGNGYWYILGEQQQVVSYQWGMGTDIPAPADYDGDGKTDFCVYRPSMGEWHIVRSSDNSSYGLQFGIAEDIPAAADFDGDGKADFALWRPSTLSWYILQSSNNTLAVTALGASGDKPVPADFDGDGKADFAMWRNNTATFWVKQSSNNQIISKAVGQTGDLPLIGDYNGDGKFDFATRQSSNNTWKIQPSSNSASYNEQLGMETDIAVPGDYDKDGKTDIAVWRPATGMWYIRNSHDGSLRTEQWGMEGDIPVPAPYRR